YSLWEVILSGDSPTPTRIVDGVVQVIAPTTAEQRLAKKNELKDKGTLLMALSDKNQLKFNIHKDAKSLIKAIKKRFGGNKETKKVQKTLLKLQYENFSETSSESLDQIHDRLQKLISQLEILADLEEQRLDDLFNNLKIYEAEVKGSSTSSQNTQNIAFVSSNNTDITNESVSVVPSVSAVSSKDLVSTLLNVYSLSDAVIYSFFASQSNSPQLDNEDLKQIDADDLEEIDLKWQMAMLTMRARRRCHFAREYRSPRDNRNKDTPRRTVPVEVSTSNVLVSQCDAVGSYDWSFQADEEPTNYALMAYASSGSSSSSGYDNETFSKNRSKLLESQVGDKTSLGFNSQVFDRQVFNCEELHSYESDDSVPKSPVDDSKPVINVFNVESSSNKPSKDMSKTLRPDAPIIKDWTSDSEYEYEIEYVPKQKEPSFVLTSENVKTPRESVKKGNPLQALKDKGVIDSGNPNGGKISGKGKIKIGKLDFDDVYFVKELKFNLFSVSQICDKKNNVLFTDTECVVLSSDFKPPDENHVLLRVPRENNMYNVDLKNVVPSRDLTCLFEKAKLDESNLWHRRLGHINFKTMNKLVKGNLVRGLPSKIFENNHTCVACKKRKQHRASWIGPTWLFDIDTLTKSMNYQLVVAGNQPNVNAGIKENLDAGKVGKETVSAQQYVLLPLWSTGSQDPRNLDADVVDVAFDVKENENDVHVSANGSDKSESKKHDEKAKIDAKGKCPIGSLIRVKYLRAEFEEFLLTVLTGPSDTVVSPNFRIAIKSSFVDPFTYPNDPDMPELEDIVYSDDEENVGAEANFSNLETNISISPILTTRVHKDHHVNQIIGDLNSAPQTKSMARVVKEQGGLHQINDEDFHTCMFACFLSQKEPKKVHQELKDPSWIEAMQEELLQFKMQKGHTKEEGIDYDEVFAPVARIEAIRLFLAYASFMGFMVYQINVKSNFLYGTIDEEVYVCQPPGFEDPDYADKVYKVVKALYGLHQAPRAWYETLANYLLENGFQKGKIDQTLFIKKQKEDILLVQVYVDDIIFGSTNKQLCKAFEKLMKDKFQMSSMGELTFFLGLQVKQKNDGIFISQDKYVAKILRKFSFQDVKSAITPIETEKPLIKDPDGEDVDVHIYRSMIGSLMYLTSSRPDIMKSTTEGCQFLSCRLIYWQCKKKTVVATSSTKAEYVAATSCCAQVLWIQNQLLNYGKELASPKQTTLGVNTPRCDEDSLELMELMVFMYALVVNPTIYVSCIKQFWASATIKKVNDVVQFRALIDGKKVVVIEDVIRQDLHLDNVDGWKFLIHTLVQCINAKRTAWNDFSCSMAYAVICLATVIINNQVDDLTTHNTKYTSPALTQKAAEEDEEVKVPTDHAPPSPTSAPSLPPQDFIPTPSQAQPATPSSPTPEQPTETFESSIPLLNTLLETWGIEDINADKDITLVDVETQVDMDVKLQGRINQDVSAVATKDVSVVEPTVFDDEEVTMTMAQTLIKMKAKKKQNSLMNKLLKGCMMKKLKKLQPGKSKKKMIWKELKKYQSLKKKPVSIAQARKNMITYLKNMAGYKMEHFRGSRSYWKIIKVGGITEAYQSFKDTLKGFDREIMIALWSLVKEKSSLAMPNVDKEKALWVELKRLFEPDVDDVLWKLQRYMLYLITWKLYSNCGVHQVSSTTRRHDIFMLTEKDYPLSNGVMTLILSAKLQVEEDSEMARDLMMKIFIKANKPKSKSLDTSSK
nr:putative ribonuclease H-like domain-containing protein [Tanacetum cinerariifolium]